MATPRGRQQEDVVSLSSSDSDMEVVDPTPPSLATHQSSQQGSPRAVVSGVGAKRAREEDEAPHNSTPSGLPAPPRPPMVVVDVIDDDKDDEGDGMLVLSNAAPSEPTAPAAARPSASALIISTPTLGPTSSPNTLGGSSGRKLTAEERIFGTTAADGISLSSSATPMRPITLDRAQAGVSPSLYTRASMAARGVSSASSGATSMANDQHKHPPLTHHLEEELIAFANATTSNSHDDVDYTQLYVPREVLMMRRQQQQHHQARASMSMMGGVGGGASMMNAMGGGIGNTKRSLISGITPFDKEADALTEQTQKGLLPKLQQALRDRREAHQQARQEGGGGISSYSSAIGRHTSIAPSAAASQAPPAESTNTPTNIQSGSLRLDAPQSSKQHSPVPKLRCCVAK